jgi:hypothetical protein
VLFEPVVVAAFRIMAALTDIAVELGKQINALLSRHFAALEGCKQAMAHGVPAALACRTEDNCSHGGW